MELKNKAEFEEFKKWFMFWRAKLGLQRWRILYFTQIPTDEKGCPYATISCILEQHEAWVYFYGATPVRKGWAKEKALHECLHLLLAPLNSDGTQEHVVINSILEGLYDG